MPPSNPLQIATSALSRLAQERKSYIVESEAHERRLKVLEQRLKQEGPEAEDGNLEWILDQEKRAYKETKAVFGPLGQKIEEAERRVRGLLEDAGEGESEKGDRERAQEVLREVERAKTRDGNGDVNEDGGGGKLS